MKRLNKEEWTDGKDIYVGSPKEGFRLKEAPINLHNPPVDSGPVELHPATPDEDVAELGND